MVREWKVRNISKKIEHFMKYMEKKSRPFKSMTVVNVSKLFLNKSVFYLFAGGNEGRRWIYFYITLRNDNFQ